MIKRVIKYFFPELSDPEIRKYGLLSLVFFFIIGSYWLLRLLKNTVLFKIAFPVELGWPEGYGRLMQPIAKFWSPFIIISLMLIYSKLVDTVRRHQLFYIICSFYAVIFAGIGVCLGIKSLFGMEYVGKNVLAATGWATYFAAESFGSLATALFWSFTTSVSTTSEAKRAFPFIIAGAQVGSIFGSSLPFFTRYIGGVWSLFILSSLFLVLLILTMRHFIKTTPKEQLVGNIEAAKTREKKKEGFVESFTSGLVLLFTRPYLFGVLIVSTFYEVAGTLVDYQMQSLADLSPYFAGEVGFANFQAIYGISVNTLAFLMALLGTRQLIKILPLRICLLIYPTSFFTTITGLFVYYYFWAPPMCNMLWATLAAMVCIKGLSYSINNPTKEMMYIPTSKDAKFKTKGWIDTFGNRMSKLGGARVSNVFKDNLNELMVYGTAISLGVIGFWFLAAVYVGMRNHQLRKEGKIVK